METRCVTIRVCPGMRGCAGGGIVLNPSPRLNRRQFPVRKFHRFPAAGAEMLWLRVSVIFSHRGATSAEHLANNAREDHLA